MLSFYPTVDGERLLAVFSSVKPFSRAVVTQNSKIMALSEGGELSGAEKS